MSNNLDAPVFLNFVSGGGVITASDNVVLDNGINGVQIDGTINGSLTLDWSNQTDEEYYNKFSVYSEKALKVFEESYDFRINDEDYVNRIDFSNP